MTSIGLILFVLIFVVIAPQSQKFLLGVAASTVAFLTAWAPFSYLLVLIVLAAPFVGMYLVNNAPRTVVPENPMAKYKKEVPLDQD